MNPVKKLLTAFSFSLLLFTNAQVKDTITPKKLYVKANALFLPVGVVNAGLEYQLSKKMTIQGEVFISPWKSFAGKYAQVYMIGLDVRYYFDMAFKHFYLGANISAVRYKMQKFNYWGDGEVQYNFTGPFYNKADLYQNGHSLMLGATVGYQFELSKNWNMELFLGAGSIQSYYQGYHKYLGIRYDNDGRKWDRSGEFLPYKGGVMISYKLR